MSTIRFTLFPEYQKEIQKIYHPRFIQAIETHILGLGYKSKIVGEELVIVGPDGGLSSSPGTLIGFKFVSEIEDFLIENGFSWMRPNSDDIEKMREIFSIVSELARTISEKICEHESLSNG